MSDCDCTAAEKRFDFAYDYMKWMILLANKLRLCFLIQIAISHFEYSICVVYGYNAILSQTIYLYISVCSLYFLYSLYKGIEQLETSFIFASFPNRSFFHPY